MGVGVGPAPQRGSRSLDIQALDGGEQVAIAAQLPRLPPCNAKVYGDKQQPNRQEKQQFYAALFHNLMIRHLTWQFLRMWHPALRSDK